MYGPAKIVEKIKRKANTEGKKTNWEAMVADDHVEMDKNKKTTASNRKGVVTERLSYSLQKDRDHHHQRTQCPHIPPHKNPQKYRHHQEAPPPTHKSPVQWDEVAHSLEGIDLLITSVILCTGRSATSSTWLTTRLAQR